MLSRDHRGAKYYEAFELMIKRMLVLDHDTLEQAFVYRKSIAICDTTKQTSIPVNVGMRNASAVHFQLPVSFLIVSIVVAQGKWISENSMVQMAVTQVHPLATNSSLRAARLSISNI